jgi:hypothetical protein
MSRAHYSTLLYSFLTLANIHPETHIYLIGCSHVCSWDVD